MHNESEREATPVPHVVVREPHEPRDPSVTPGVRLVFVIVTLISAVLTATATVLIGLRLR